MSHNHNIVDTDKLFIVDPFTRTINTDSGNKIAIMQYDHKSERLTFQIPRMIEGHDMSLSDVVQVHYTNTSTGTSISNRQQSPGIATLTDLRTSPDDEDTLICSWLISQHATQYAGTLSFLLKFICTGEADSDELEYVWHTNICSYINVLPGLNNSDDIATVYPDVLTQMSKRLDAISTDNEDDDTRLSAIEKDIADLKYKPITVSSFTNNVNTVEIGSTVNSVTLSWKLNKDAVMATIDSTAVDTSQNGSLVLTDLAIKANKTWTLKVSDERETSASKTTSVTFLNGVYYGAAPAGTIDSSFVRSLTRTLRSNKLPSFTLTTTTNQYMWYCVPTRYGKCTFMNNNVTGGFFLADTIDFTNASGYTESYYIYRSDYPSLGTKTMTVS